MPALFPVFEVPSPIFERAPAMPEYPKSYLFDFEKGDFVKDGSGRVVVADGYTAWKQWCIKAVLTQRFSFLAYGWDYGVELDRAIKMPVRSAVEAEAERVIREALMVDPRTEKVDSFRFRWLGDQLWVSFVATPVVGEPVVIEEVRIDAT